MDQIDCWRQNDFSKANKNWPHPVRFPPFSMRWSCVGHSGHGFVTYFGWQIYGEKSQVLLMRVQTVGTHGKSYTLVKRVGIIYGRYGNHIQLLHSWLQGWHFGGLTDLTTARIKWDEPFMDPPEIIPKWSSAIFGESVSFLGFTPWLWIPPFCLATSALYHAMILRMLLGAVVLETGLFSGCLVPRICTTNSDNNSCECAGCSQIM